jgi:DNA processing protein
VTVTAPESWRTLAFELAASGRADAACQQRVLRDLLERGAACTPAQVVEALRRAVAPAATAAGVARRARARLAALGGWFLTVADDGYPATLRAAWPELGAPVWLFGSGAWTCLDDAVAVAVVGTRTPTLDGLRTARLVAGALARAGAVVVSGLAKGIDQAAHRAALDAGARTVAVLGTGLGVDYPARSAALRAEIAERGALLSELPPGAGARPWHFLARNRIISGLAAATVVVEGGLTSGALQTARLAAGQGRDVWAVPGSINTPTSQAPLALLRDGALPLTGVDVLLESLGLAGGAAGDAATPGGTAHAIADLSEAARNVLTLLGAVPATTDALVTAGTLPAHTTMAAVAELIESGQAVATPGGVVRA